ncbi:MULTISPECIES: serine/threonine-protein kinase [unclassified Streptomyces]|uniref:serine/threonine-protein kinase n=1 Tax=unclassified Streptomyces TaxID=2593676 RepID=UPI000F6D5272|nr:MULTISPECIES: serine/threonine-protein kinase [unclassified Streptomyces]AZM60829.1 serine/threonine protein kinase [Streptomyces sp. WAC 01438]RSM87647.1 serine/threonine protein kinase [Streptomyces sp. WAC 01420]
MAPQRNAGAGAEAELPEYAGHYRLEPCLGSGGMGVVHLARSPSGMRVAVKVVHARYARDPEFRGRFRQEVAAARRVSGAFTAPVVDADPEGVRPWMATLYIPGPTLSEQVKRNGPMDPDQSRRLMAGLAEALRDIHRVGVVHRDLKPSNVLLAEDGPKVIDFGISRPRDSELRTETGKLIGTPPFMAPEQFRRPREVGPEADVFALGSLVVHATTGRGPFDSDSPYVVAYQVVHNEPDLTGVPESLAPLVLRCLAKEPGDRPTPDELMRELRSLSAAYETQLFVPAPRTPAASEAAKEPGSSAKGPEFPAEAPEEAAGERPVRRLGLRTAVVAGALCLAVLGGFTAVQMLGGTETARKAPAAQSAAGRYGTWETTPAPDSGGMPQCTPMTEGLLCALPGLVFALDPADGRTLWRHEAEGTVRSEPPVVAGGFVHPSLDRIGDLEALDPATGERVWRKDAPEYQGLEAVGDMLLLTRGDGTVTGVDAASGETRWSTRIPGHGVPYFTSFARETAETGETGTAGQAVKAAEPSAYTTSTSRDGGRTRVTAVDPATGEVRWDAELEGSLTPVGAAGGDVYLVADGDVSGDAEAVLRYTPATGDTRRVTLEVPVAEAQGGVHGDTVYLMGAGGSLVAVDMAAGTERWRLETGVSRGSVPASDGRHVYVTAPDGRLLGVDAREGKLLGQTRPRLGADSDRVPASLPTPVLAGGHVYAGAPDGTVFGMSGRDPAAW